jgi:2-oxoglutarate ferredoxin oxidoreductase subunit beta
MPKFGDGELLKVTGLTHNQRGIPCENSPEIHERMVNHHRRKIISKGNELKDVEGYLLDDVEILIIAYGHTARSARWATTEARKKGIKAGMLNLKTIYPFPEEIIKKWSEIAKCVLIPEMNQGQLFYVVRESSLAPVISMPQPNGENIDPRRILHFLETIEKKYFKDITPTLPSTIYDPPEWQEDSTKASERTFSFQTPFCAGCGLGIMRNCLLEAIQEVNWPTDKIVLVSGIGCTARLPNHLPFDSANTTHGYPVPFATGVKLSQPDLHVIVVSGDGDLFDIGVGQTIHGAIRNPPILTICFNNFVFGMTGGQVAATTPYGAVTATTTTGNKRPPLDLVRLMLGANAKYVARCPVSKPILLTRILKNALSFNEFSFVEVISPCLTGYGRRNELLSPTQTWRKLNQAYVTKELAQKTSITALEEKFKLLFPIKKEIAREEILQITYGHFSNLKEYINLIPEDDQ